MTSQAPEPPGTPLLPGKYRLVRLLGEGGMGRVYEALHVDLERRVTIKVLHAELRENVDLVERFVREGRAASKIDCEHVAAVLDVDRASDGTPFIVMEYVDGQDLRSSAGRRARCRSKRPSSTSFRPVSRSGRRTRAA